MCSVHSNLIEIYNNYNILLLYITIKSLYILTKIDTPKTLDII